VAGWREEAVNEITRLKSYWVDKHGWQLEHVDADEVVDLFVRVHSRRLGRTFLLRLRYLPDWQTTGRRETFVNPDDRTQEGIEFWPPHGSVRGINPQYQPQPNGPVIPCICLKGVWGYHSVLHAGERPDGTTLLRFLVELQGVFDEEAA
jgi:hypothetical protein